MAIPDIASIQIHSSQYPAAVRRALVESLRSRQMNHKFHYESPKQVGRWLALHEAYSPARRDPACLTAYEEAFAALAAAVAAPRVQVVGLGCGGGWKDAALLRQLRAPGRERFYTPLDVSPAMVLEGWTTVLAELPASRCFPFVCDLVLAGDLRGALVEPSAAGAERIYTFFGMAPNFEPGVILPRLAALLEPGDWLLFSANLAPGDDYAAGVRRVAPQYDNAPTRDWLMTLPIDLGIEREDGSLRFEVEADPAGSELLRLAAYFDFAQSRELVLDGESIRFCQGDRLRLFFSYRHTPARVHAALEPFGLRVVSEWIAASGEEGVFLVRRPAV